VTAKTPAAAAPTTAWRNRITGSGQEGPDQLLANPANWRIHPKAQQDALAGALDQVGWVQQVLVNRRTGFVVDGHARVALALSRGEPTVPVLYVDLDPGEEALVLATLDPISAMAGRDDEKLRALLAEISVDDAGLLALLGDLAGNDPKSGLTDPDDVPEPPEEPYVKPGELYLLGDHRLLVRRRDQARGRGTAPGRGGPDAARDRPALRRAARPDLARRRLQRGRGSKPSGGSPAKLSPIGQGAFGTGCRPAGRRYCTRPVGHGEVRLSGGPKRCSDADSHGSLTGHRGRIPGRAGVRPSAARSDGSAHPGPSPGRARERLRRRHPSSSSTL